MHLQLPNLLTCEPFRGWELSQAQALNTVPATVARAWSDLRPELEMSAFGVALAAVFLVPVAVLLTHLKLQPPLGSEVQHLMVGV